MGWFVDFFAHEMKRGYEDPAERAKGFEKRLEHELERQAAERKYADMSSAPKYRFSHLQLNPFYEQNSKMFPHRRYVRREGSSSS